MPVPKKIQPINSLHPLLPGTDKKMEILNSQRSPLSTTKQKILDILSKSEQTTLSTLYDEMGLSYPALEAELVELKRLGLAIDDFTMDEHPFLVWRKQLTSLV